MTLFEAQRMLIAGSDTSVIFDVGAHEGYTTVEYLEGFAEATVFAFEPDKANHREEERLRPYGTRVRLERLALSNKSGENEFSR
jgi:FkbM family methyltransferase